ncbi:hypothetical protein MY11210_002753 [Beauveria gryllotalpidicola]
MYDYVALKPLRAHDGLLWPSPRDNASGFSMDKYCNAETWRRRQSEHDCARSVCKSLGSLAITSLRPMAYVATNTPIANTRATGESAKAAAKRTRTEFCGRERSQSGSCKAKGVGNGGGSSHNVLRTP